MKFESGRYSGRSSQEKGVSTPHQWTRRMQQTRYWLKSFSAWKLSVTGSSVTFQSVLLSMVLFLIWVRVPILKVLPPS
jgi:hypothetical protein